MVVYLRAFVIYRTEKLLGRKIGFADEGVGRQEVGIFVDCFNETCSDTLSFRVVPHAESDDPNGIG